MYTIKPGSWQSTQDNNISTVIIEDDKGHKASIKLEGDKDILESAISKLTELDKT